MKNQFFLVALSAMLLCVTQSQAAFVAAVDLDPVDGPQTLHPNFSFGGDTTSASDSVQSYAVGLPAHQSLFGGNGDPLLDTYIMSYTPGVDVDNFSPAPGSLLGSVTGFGTELASGAAGGVSGTYNVYVTTPASASTIPDNTFTLTGDGAPVVISGVGMASGGTGADLDPGAAFVGGANNAWYLLGSVDLTAGNTYTMTQETTANSFVSMRLAGVMWELQAVPEPTSIALISLGGVAMLFAGRRRNG